jgi:hypothetical protein
MKNKISISLALIFIVLFILIYNIIVEKSYSLLDVLVPILIIVSQILVIVNINQESKKNK